MADTPTAECRCLYQCCCASDRQEAMTECAKMARQGLHDLAPYWSPDTDSTHDPLDDPEIREAVRRFVGRRWSHLRKEAR